MNGLYDWGWLRTDGGVLMPPSNQLEEVGALAAMVDENQLKYSLDAICQRYGLPGKDTALLEEACKAAGFKISKKTPMPILHLATAGAPSRPLRRDRCGANARSCPKFSSRSSSGKARATPIG